MPSGVWAPSRQALGLVSATAGRLAGRGAAHRLAAAALAATGFAAALGLAAAGLAAALGLAATVFLAATALLAARIAGRFATAARSGGAGRLGTARRGHRGSAGRGGAARRGFAARRLAAMTGTNAIAQARLAALGSAAGRLGSTHGFATAAAAAGKRRRGQQQHAKHERETTNTVLHGRDSSRYRKRLNEVETQFPINACSFAGGRDAFRVLGGRLGPAPRGFLGSAISCC